MAGRRGGWPPDGEATVGVVRAASTAAASAARGGKSTGLPELTATAPTGSVFAFFAADPCSCSSEEELRPSKGSDSSAAAAVASAKATVPWLTDEPPSAFEPRGDIAAGFAGEAAVPAPLDK